MNEPLPTQVAPPVPRPAGAVPVPLEDPSAFSLGRILSRTFRVWWQGARGFVAIGALASLPSAIGAFVVYTQQPELARGPQPERLMAVSSVREYVEILLEHSLAVSKAFLPYTLLALACAVVMMGAVAHGALRRLAGERPGPLAMIGVGLRTGPAILGAWFLLSLASLPALLALIFPAVVLAVGWCAAIPAIVAEGQGPVAALRRSWRLTRGHRWPLFLAFLVVGAAMMGALMVVQLPYGMYVGFQAVQSGGMIDPAALAGPTAALTLVSGAGHTLLLVTPAVAYRELRDVKEGRDPVVLGKVFE